MLKVQNDYDLGEANALGLPSRAKYFALIRSVSDLQDALRFARDKKVPILALGEGSNLVLKNQIPALVLKIDLKGMRILESDQAGALVELAAGENWHQALSWCLRQALSGAENLALIPGSVGAAPVQNIGAYGVEISDCLESLEYFDLVTGDLVQLSNADCHFAYRDSRFKRDLRDRAVITRIRLRLTAFDRSSQLPASAASSSYPVLDDFLQQQQLAATPQNVFDAVCTIRRSRLPDPAQEPNVGSFFHNPIVENAHYADLQKRYRDIPGHPLTQGGVKIPAAWLIENRGWKGKSIAGVRISDQHALVLTNPARCSAKNVMEAAAIIQKSVMDEFAIQLDIEPRVYPA